MSGTPWNPCIPVDNLEKTLDQTASALANQTQDAKQKNFSKQGLVVAVAKNCGEAAACQLSYQQNINYQQALEEAKNKECPEEALAYPCCEDLNHKTCASLTQTQPIYQKNVNKQKNSEKEVSANEQINSKTYGAFANAENIDGEKQYISLGADKQQQKIADSDSCSSIIDRGCENRVEGEVKAELNDSCLQARENKSGNFYIKDDRQVGTCSASYPSQPATAQADGNQEECCSTVNQTADASVKQAQDVGQTNRSEQDLAVAIAIGNNSFAFALQAISQSNDNAQDASSSAFNGVDVACCNLGLTPARSSSAQTQDINETNINFQSSAVAIAIDGGSSTAIQQSNQSNYNSQSAFSEAGNENNCQGDLLNEEAKKEDIKKNENNDEIPITREVTAKQTELKELAVIALNKSGLELNIQVLPNGDVLVNTQKVKTLKI